MCGLKIMMVAGISLAQLALPPIEEGRRKNPNGFGFTETEFNPTQLKFVRRSIARTQRLQRPDRPVNFRRQPMTIDIGGGMGETCEAIVKGGGHCLYVDISDLHGAIVEARLEEASLFPSQFNTIVEPFPFLKGSSGWDKLIGIQEAFEIVDAASTQQVMYNSPEQMPEFFRQVYELLPPGGRFYLTAISPYANLFPQYLQEYERRHMEFLASHGESQPFPGWIPDVREMIPGVPESYFEMYPNFFHLWHPDVLEFHAEEAGFIVREARFLRRLKPERLRYLGDRTDVGELASLIAQKPKFPIRKPR